MSYERCFGGGSRVTTSTGGKGGERPCECGSNIGDFQMIFAMRIAEEPDVVDGGLNPRLSGAALKAGTNFAANSWRPECGAMDPCQRRKPPEAVAKGQRLQGSVAR